MNYPVWYLPGVGGGLLIAAIAIVHVFISHFAVGGGLYLVLAERKGLREKSGAILDFTRAHTRFFLLATVVASSITGVAIWWIISLVHPAATSLLIHIFVFGWATEWVLFLVEVVSIFVYFYTFGRMDDRTHQIVGWIYFIAAWLSLFVINGIIGFMLDPGAWPADRSFWSGFFNPLFWPSLFFRTAVACMFAGVYAFLTTAFLADPETKRTMTLYSGKWVLSSWLAAIPCGIWYFRGVPAEARTLIAGASPTIQRALQAGLWAVVALAVLTLILVILKPARHTRPVSLFVFLSAFVFMGAFEWTREAARRPYVINRVMYSNGVPVADVPRLQRTGYLEAALWTSHKAVDEGNLLEAGKELFIHQCHACHTIGGANNDILARTRNMSYPAMAAYIRTIHEKRYFMPPFAGTEAEGKALAAFIVKGLHGKEIAERPAAAAGALSGKDVFEQHCSGCHTLSGDDNPLPPKVAKWDRKKIREALDRLETLKGGVMPPLDAPPAEKDALADFLVSTQQGGAK
ncbi:MAG: c-type cytochrome [Deltaproteobacteria bacterium]|nr:c-type cytochrome [Deltaproteobacteria bacterium]